MNPNTVSAILRDPNATLMPCTLGVYCDNCEVTFEGPFMVDVNSTHEERLAVVRRHVVRFLNWNCGEHFDFCPTCVYPASMLRTMSQRYGVYVAHVSEDGEMLALGHDVDQRRMVAAFSAEERDVTGDRLANQVRFDRTPDDKVYETFVGSLCKLWATHTDNTWGWFVDWSARFDTEGAFPITLWRP